MTRTVVDLREWESDRRVQGVSLSDHDRVLAATLTAGEGRLRVTELSDGLRFDASAWVGVVRFSTIEVRVTPKLVGENLGVLQMLEYSSGLEALARLESARTLAASRGGSLVDLLALLLAESSLQIAKGGILQDYVSHQESLPRLRGRLLPYEQVTRHFGQVDQLECVFDEHETDIDENRILATGLEIARRAATDEQARTKAVRAAAIFREVADTRAIHPGSRHVEFTRRNEHYRTAHTLAWMFIRNLAVNNLYSPGGGDSFAFLLDMNRLFEDFVTRLLTDAFEGTDVRVRPQRRDRTLITDARTGRPYAAVIPDVLLERRGLDKRQVPVDAKYKLYDDRKIDQSDIYQTFFYAWAYKGRDDDIAPAFILYPGAASAPGAHLLAQARAGGAAAHIRAIPIDVPAALSAIRRREPVRFVELREAMIS